MEDGGGYIFLAWVEGEKYVTIFSSYCIVSAVSKYFEGMLKEGSFTWNTKICNNNSSYYGDDHLGAEGYSVNAQIASCVVKSSLLFLWPSQINVATLKRK